MIFRKAVLLSLGMLAVHAEEEAPAAVCPEKGLYDSTRAELDLVKSQFDSAAVKHKEEVAKLTAQAAKVATFETENTALAAKVAALGDASSSLASCEKTREGLSAEKERLTAEKAQLSKSVSDSQTLVVEKQKLETELKTMVGKSTELASCLSSKKSSEDGMKGKMDHLQSELSQLKSDAERDLKDVEVRLSAAKRDLATMEKVVEVQKSEASEALRRLNEISSDATLISYKQLKEAVLKYVSFASAAGSYTYDQVLQRIPEEVFSKFAAFRAEAAILYNAKVAAHVDGFMTPVMRPVEVGQKLYTVHAAPKVSVAKEVVLLKGQDVFAKAKEGYTTVSAKVNTLVDIHVAEPLFAVHPHLRALVPVSFCDRCLLLSYLIICPVVVYSLIPGLFFAVIFGLLRFGLKVAIPCCWCARRNPKPVAAASKKGKNFQTAQQAANQQRKTKEVHTKQPSKRSPKQ